MSRKYISLKMCAKRLLQIFNLLLPEKKHTQLLHTYTLELLRKQLRIANVRGHYTLFPYQNPIVKTALFAFKYEKSEKAILWFATILNEFLDTLYQQQELSKDSEYYLICVPMTNVRKQRDGYDHLAFLRQKIIALTKSTIQLSSRDTSALLFWNRDIKRQSSLEGLKERKKNVSGALSISQPLPNSHAMAIVIDDVSTTGSTLDECKATLKRAGIEKVLTIALAH